MYGNNVMDPKAQKRFDNDRTRAAQSALIGQSAKNAIPTPTSNVSRPGSNVAKMVNSPQTQLAQPNTSPAPSMSMSGSGPAPVQMQQPVSVEETIKNNIDLEKFLSSPEIQESMARSKLRKFFARNSPNGSIDVASDALANLLHDT